MNRWTEGIATLGRSLACLTQAERRLLCLIAALALLGLGVKWWTRHVAEPPPPPISTTNR